VALPFSAVRRVFRMVSIRTRLPGAPEGCLGLADFRGSMLPVFDLAARLGFCAPRSDVALVDGYVVVVREPAGYVGYAVDDLRELVDVEAEPLGSDSSAQMGSGVIGAVRLDETTVVPLLDHRQLLSAAGREELLRAVLAFSAGLPQSKP